ncbi:unnamed protein product [Closterium sp. Naga37s-1]|nr:unnamed protein product [Closterium sp. Naga37s-1]
MNDTSFLSASSTQISCSQAMVAFRFPFRNHPDFFPSISQIIPSSAGSPPPPPSPGMFTNSASAIVVGLVLDRTGPRRTTLIGTAIFALGLLALAGAGAFAPGAHNDAAPDGATRPSGTNGTNSNSTANATVVVPAAAEPANSSAAAVAVTGARPQRGLMRVEAAWLNGGLPIPGGSWAQLIGGIRGAHGAGEAARTVKVMGKARVERTGWGEGHACWRRSGGCPGEQVMRSDPGVQRRQLEAEGQGSAGGTAEGSSGGKEEASGVLFFAAFFLLSLGGPFIFTSSINFCVLVPRLSSAIISAQAGAFEASSLILFLLGLAVTRLHLPLSALALAYCLVPLALAALAAAAFPNSPFGAAKSGASGGTGDTHADGGLGDAAGAGVLVKGEGGGDGAEVGVRGKEGEWEGQGEVVLVARPNEEVGGEMGAAEGGIADDEGIEECSSSSSSSSSGSGGEMGSGERERKDSVIAMVAPLFWVHVAVSAYLVLRSNFFIAAVNTHIRYTVTTLLSIPPSTATTDLPSDAAAQVTSYIDIFNIVLAAGGVFAVPLAGWSMERPGLPFSFALTTLLCVLCSAVQMMAAWVPLSMQLVAFLAFAIARAFIYSTMAAYVGTLFGIIYGYSGILPVLVGEVGAFSDACGAGEDVPCAAQMSLLNAAYTLSMVTNSACVLPVGAFLDAYGPRTTAITGSLVFSAGLLALALGSAFSHPGLPAPPPALPAPSPSASLLSMPSAFPAYQPHQTLSPLLLRPLPPSWPLHYCPHRFELSDNLSQPITGRHVGAPGDRDNAWDEDGMATRGEGARSGGEGIRGMTEGLGWVAGGLRGVKKGVGVAGVCFFAAFFLLALGGPFILTPMINFSELLPSSAAAVIAAQSGAFDASAAMLFLFALAVSRLHLALSAVCLAYLAVPLVIAAVAAATFPDVPFGASPTSESHTTPPSTSTSPSSTSPHPDPLSLLTAPLLQPASEEHSSKRQASKEQSPQRQSDEEEGERGQARPAVERSGGRHEDACGEEEGMRGAREGIGAGLTAMGRRDEEGGGTGGSREGARGPRRSGELERLYLLRLMGAAGSDKAAGGDAGGASSAAAADELTTSAHHVALPGVTGRGSSIPLSPSLPIVWLHGRSTPCLPPPPAIYNADIATQLRCPVTPVLGARGGGALRLCGFVCISTPPLPLLSPALLPLVTPVLGARGASTSPLFWVHVGVAAFYVLRSNVYIAAVNDQISFAVHAKAIHPPSTAAAVEQSYINAFNCLLPAYANAPCLPSFSPPPQLQHAKAIHPPPTAAAVQQHYIDAFNCLLPLGGCLSVPLAGWSIDSLGLPPAFAITAALSLLSSLLLLLAPCLPLDAMVSRPLVLAALVSFTAYSIARAFIYSTMAALIASLFGFRNFGRLYGLTRFIGAFAALLQYPLMRYGEEAMGGDFTGMTAGFMACELALATLFPLYLTHCLFGFFWRPKP